MFTSYNRAVFYQIVEDACVTEINRVFIQYYDGEITEREYAETIVPILESYGYYDELFCRALFINDVSEVDAYVEEWGTEVALLDLKSSLRDVDLEDEINAIYYGPLFEMLP